MKRTSGNGRENTPFLSFSPLGSSFLFFFFRSVTKRGHAHADHVGRSQVIAYLWAARACGPSMSPRLPSLHGSFLASTMPVDIPFSPFRISLAGATSTLQSSPASNFARRLVDIIHNWPGKSSDRFHTHRDTIVLIRNVCRPH